MAGWKIESLGINSDIMQNVSNQEAIASAYGDKWKFADKKKHSEMTNKPIPIDPEEEAMKVSMQADPYDPMLLRSMPMDSLKSVAASLGVLKIPDSKEKIIEAIREKAGLRAPVAASVPSDESEFEAMLEEERNEFRESLEDKTIQELQEIAKSLNIIKPALNRDKLIEQIMLKK